MSIPPCIILCGGIGSRLGDIVKETPKCLVLLNKKPFLYYQLKLLQEAGVKKIILCTGYLSTQVDKFVNDLDIEIEILISADGDNPLGTGGAVKKALDLVDGPAFVTYGDTLLDTSYKDIYKQYKKLRKHNPLMVIYQNNMQFDASNVYLHKGKIIYKKQNPHVDSKYIDYGLSIFSKDDFIDFKDSFDLSEAQEDFSKNGSLAYYEAKKRFYEIGTPASLLEAENYLLKNDY